MFSVASSFSSVIYQGTLQSSHCDGKCTSTFVMHLCFLETEQNRLMQDLSLISVAIVVTPII